ncbi:NAD-dependent epimerase/dehydratase family protein [Streptomyces sp. NPDC099050]|uniref:NAD-dependent epimerase/dehydratase family protein n=1 Tax=Streptomyces sp. NPDC099050 TaxID=3366100 RepID=UPI0037F149C1
MPQIVITGGSGFIGSHVTRHAESLHLPLRLMSHRTRVPATAPGTETVPGDLRDPGSLRGLCEGAEVLIHCASQIGGPPELCEAVNARGTEALMEEALRGGVSRIVYLSTVAVYGRGSYRRARVADLARNPLSDTSRTRAAAEDAVLAAGGIVLRPHLVYGAEDTKVVPALARLLVNMPGSVEGWSRRTSAIAAEDLARVLVATALAPAGRLTESVYHANHPEPVLWSDLLRAVSTALSLPRPDTDLTAQEARDFLATRGISSHDLDMLTSDHWFDSSLIWTDADCAPGPGFTHRFPRHAAWYRDSLAAGPVSV